MGLQKSLVTCALSAGLAGAGFVATAQAQQIPNGIFGQSEFVTVQSGISATARNQSALNDAVSVRRSNNSVLVQSGNNNTASSIVQNSPESNILQVQEGNENLATAAIVGGNNNNIVQAQVGNNKGSLVGLVNSVGTTVIHAQYNQKSGQAASAPQVSRQAAGAPISVRGLVLYNAPPGTIVILPK